MLSIKKEKLTQAIKDLIKFDKTIDNYYQKAKINREKKKDKGYLMNKKILDELKDKLNYSIIKDTPDKSFYKKVYENFKFVDEIDFEGCEQRIFKNYKEMEEDLKKNNEYIIVDKTIWNLINNGKISEYEGIMTYEINKRDLILFLNDNEKAHFKHNKNIINYKNLIKEEKNSTIVEDNDIDDEFEEEDKKKYFDSLKNQNK